MRSLLPGDRVVPGAGIIRHSLVSAALLTSAMVVVGLAQLGGTPAPSTTHTTSESSTVDVLTYYPFRVFLP